MNLIRGSFGGSRSTRSRSRSYRVACVVGAWLLCVAVCPAVVAQTPLPAAKNPASKDSEGFSAGWTLGERFEGSYSTAAGVYDLRSEERRVGKEGRSRWSQSHEK